LVTFFFFIFIAAVTQAAPQYERTVDQLSQAVTTYKELSGHQEKYNVAFRRDPMKPLIDTQGNLLTTSGLKDGLWVQGIIWSEERPLVVIEGDLYAQGDTFDDYTVREIRKDGAVIEHGGQTQLIPIDRGFESPAPSP